MIYCEAELPSMEYLSPIYRDALEKLLHALDSNLVDWKIREEHFEDYISKFTTLPFIWIKFALLNYHDPNLSNSDEKEKKEKITYIKAISHFFHHNYPFYDTWELFEGKLIYWTKLLDSRTCFKDYLYVTTHLHTLQTIEDLLILPNDSLKSYKKSYLEFSTKPITNELEKGYQNALKLYEKIITVENNNEKWLNALKEVNDDKFIIQNIEFRLGVNPVDKNMWLMYLEFLEEKQYIKWALDVYSRYCRFFTDDLKIREKYRATIKTAEFLLFDATKWILDSIKMEMDFVSKQSSFELFIKEFGANIAKNEKNFEIIFKNMFEYFHRKYPKPYMPDYAINHEAIRPFRTTTTPNISFKQQQPHSINHQKINLPNSILYYIMKSGNYFILQKLYASSKQIYSSIFKVTICHQFVLLNSKKSFFPFQQCLFIGNDGFNFFDSLPKLYLTNSFRLELG